jgi:lysophospholipid acyltransferase (LPLAT)-like uncharacterized protein
MAETPPDPGSRRSFYARATRSTRSLTAARRALYALGVPVALGLIRFWWSSCRVVAVTGEEQLLAALADGPVIPVYWHQHQLFAIRYLLRQRSRGLVAGFMMTASVDGELPAMLARRVGAQALRGSSSYTGARVLRDSYVALQQGVSPALTPDGPKGPRYEFKQGAILVAQLSGRPMVPIAYHAARAWRFRNWDHFVLPWPFTRIAIAVGTPRHVPRGLDARGLQQLQGEMSQELRALYQTARSALTVA